jgi:uncharacterized membrane protein YedE/YeeE
MLEGLAESLGVTTLLVLSGLLVGLLFGAAAQRSRFCLRAAVVEFTTGRFGGKLVIWLMTFGVAIAAIQWLIAAGIIEVAQSRALAARGSVSGALAGGLLFGVGMVLARGCASRLLVLSATGNMRALLAGLVFVVAAQASWQGALAPLRLALAEVWPIEGGPARDILARLGLAPGWGPALAGVWLGAAVILAWRLRVNPRAWVGGALAGLSVALAYLLTFRIGLLELDPSLMRGITFSGPSTELLMRVLGGGERSPGFDTGLVPGVFLGSAMAAWLGGEWRIQVFDAASGTLRYVAGAVLMGFGAMLAGGCAVGAGVSGGSILSITAWLALGGMWLGAGVAHRVVDEAAPLAAGIEPAR